MGGQGSGRKPNPLKPFTPERAGLATIQGQNLELPNYSGVKKFSDDHSTYDGDYLKLDGSNANTNINIGSYNLTTTGVIEADSVLLNTSTADSGYQLTIVPDNRGISIIQPNQITSVANEGMILVKANDINVTTPSTLFHFEGTMTAGNSTILAMRAIPKINLNSTAGVEAIRLEPRDSTSSWTTGTHNLYGVRIQPLIITGLGLTGSQNYVIKYWSLDSASTSVFAFPGNTATIDLTGIDLKAGSYTKQLFGGTGTFNAYGIKLTGWGGGTGLDSQYAIYSNGGDVELTAGNLNTTGFVRAKFKSNDGTTGFTGTGAYTNFTIKDGIITNAT